jgi:hypothetical protein
MQYPTFPALNPPKDPNSRIWRYLTTQKFKRLVTTSELVFPCAELFNEEYEGAYPEPNRTLQDAIFKLYPIPFEREENAENAHKWNRKVTFVSCWYMAEYESDAMWKPYGKSDDPLSLSNLPSGGYAHRCPIIYISMKLNTSTIKKIAFPRTTRSTRSSSSRNG